MTNVLAKLSHWATTLPYWEQAAFEKVVSGVSFTDSDYDELLQYLLEDANLAKPLGIRPTLRFLQNIDGALQTTAPSRLIKISNLQNVNALVEGQTLTFSPALTAIYGGNGSGKSGYARVLGCAGFSRGDQDVLPDVSRTINETIVLSADIEVADGISDRVIHYKIGNKCPELSSFYVFDSTSVRVHLTQSNTLSFSPAGLSYLTQLAEVTDKVRDLLRARIEESSQAHNFGVLFQGVSDVSRLIVDLGPDTDLNALHQLATLSSDHEKQIKRLDKEIAQLKAQNVSDQIADLKQKIDDLESLVDSLHEAHDGLSDKVFEEIQNDIRVYLDRQTVAQSVSISQFKSEYFTQTGSELWYQFIKAANALAKAERTGDESYPQPNSRCLLCQQPLTTEARDLILRLWKFLEGEAQSRLEKAKVLLEEKCKTIDSISLDFFNAQSVSYRHLQNHDANLLGKIEVFITDCYRRRDNILKAIDTCSEELDFSSLPENGILKTEQIITLLKARLNELEKIDPSEVITELEQKLRNLQHRVLLGQNLSAIEDYVRKRIWAKQASMIGGSTRHITEKHNDLFKELVTDRYIELFEQTLINLGRPLKIKVVTRGRKGEAYKQIVLDINPIFLAEKCTPDKVLSEGEKRAVALADFLTEVTLDTGSNGIILDDPVTSLDVEWRNLIAAILVKEASRRQVIVFIHDLLFLYYLKRHSEQEKIETITHWIKRGDYDNKPGYVFLNNSPALEREYRKPTRAHEIYAKAKDAPAAEQEALLREGFGALRTTYEAFIIFELFNEVVIRWDERVSFGRLKDIVWDKSIVGEVIYKCELLSKYIEGHLHSDVLGVPKPTPKLLFSEIEAFETLSARMKNLKKSG